MFWMTVASMLPDADVIAFTLGIPYDAPFGHRGASHALLVAPLLAILPSLYLDQLDGRAKQLRTWLLMTATIASHGILDTLTDGGLGAALGWPATDARFFAPVRPIPVSPIGASYLSPRGLYVATIETLAFAPLLAYALWPRKKTTPTHTTR